MSKVLKELTEIYDLVVQDYYKQALLADKYMIRDHEAAMRIQRMWRMHVIRQKYIKIQYELAYNIIEKHVKPYKDI